MLRLTVGENENSEVVLKLMQLQYLYDFCNHRRLPVRRIDSSAYKVLSDRQGRKLHPVT